MGKEINAELNAERTWKKLRDVHSALIISFPTISEPGSLFQAPR